MDSSEPFFYTAVYTGSNIVPAERYKINSSYFLCTREAIFRGFIKNPKLKKQSFCVTKRSIFNNKLFYMDMINSKGRVISRVSSEKGICLKHVKLC